MKAEDQTTDQGRLALIHIGFWLVYSCLELVKHSFISRIDNRMWLEVSTNILCGTVFFYVLTLIVLPRGTHKIRIFQLVWHSVLGVLFGLMLRRGIILFMAESINFKDPLVTNLDYFLVSSLDLYLKFGTYAILVWFSERQADFQKLILHNQLQEEKLKHELLEAKYAVLQAQINPHFLFNTLNFINSKAITSDNHLINKAVLLLSDILRHSLRCSDQGKLVPVHEEIVQISKLYELNRLRFEGNYYLNIVEEGVEYDANIPPLVLLTFFENMMKYGVLDDPAEPALLKITQSQKFLEIKMENKIGKDDSYKLSSHGLGKRYIKNALDKYYPNDYQLDYHNDTNIFRVHLKINQT